MSALAGDELVDGEYRPAEIVHEPDGLIWSHSAVLGCSQAAVPCPGQWGVSADAGGAAGGKAGGGESRCDRGQQGGQRGPCPSGKLRPRSAGSESWSRSMAGRSDRDHPPRNLRRRVCAKTGVRAAQNADFTPIALKTRSQERRRASLCGPPHPQSREPRESRSRPAPGCHEPCPTASYLRLRGGATVPEVHRVLAGVNQPL